MSTELVRVGESQEGGNPYAYHARRLGKRAVYHGVRGPMYVGRGLWRGAYGWYLSFGPLYRWLTDYKHEEIRDTAVREKQAHIAEKAEKQRDRQIGIRIGVVIGLVFVFPFLVAGFAGIALWSAYLLVWASIIFVQAVYGMKRAGISQVIEEPTARDIADLQLTDINDALVSAGILKRPDEKNPDRKLATLATWPERVDGGQEVTINLPQGQGVNFAKVRKAHATLANEFGLDVKQLEIRKGKSENQVILWRGDTNPFDRVLPSHPILDLSEWDAFSDGAVLGEDIRGRQIHHGLFETNFLFGGIPGSGKTTGARAGLASVIMDKHAEIAVFDGAGGADWSSLEPISVVHEDGETEQQAKVLLSYLQEQVAETRRRTAKFKESGHRKLTLEMHRNGTPMRVIVVDELQEFLSLPDIGAQINQALVDLARIARKAGIVLFLVTQRPDSTLSELFTALKAQVGTRISFRTMDWRTSDMILGEGMSKHGYATDEFTPEQQGACYVRPGETVSEIHRGMPAIFGRTYDITEEEWEAVVECGKKLRGGKTAKAELPEAPSAEETLTVPEQQQTNPHRDFAALVVDLLEETEEGKMTVARLAEYLKEDAAILGKRLRAAGIEPRHTRIGKVVDLDTAEKALS